MSNKPDYKKYSYDQLVDVKNHVDKEKYPDRYEEVCCLLESIDKPNTLKAIPKKYPTFTNSDNVIFGILSLLVVSYHVWIGHTIGRHGGFSMQNQPVLFWLCNGMFIFAFFANVVHLSVKSNNA